MKLAEIVKVLENFPTAKEEALAIMAVEADEEYGRVFHSQGPNVADKTLKATDRIVLGLVWYEFLAEDTTEAGYALANGKADLIAEKLHVDRYQIYKEVERLYGRGNRS